MANQNNQLYQDDIEAQIKIQDDLLDKFGNQIGRIKTNSIQTNYKIDTQNHILDSTTILTDNANGTTKSNIVKIDKLIEKLKCCSCRCCLLTSIILFIVALIIIIVVVIMLTKK